MNLQERDLWRLVKKHLPGEVERVENVAAGGGTPDVSGAFCRDYWVELKVCRTKKLQDLTQLCSPLQLRWHHKRARQGSRVFVMVRHGDALLLYYVQLRADKSTSHDLVWMDSKPWNWGALIDEMVVRLR